MSDMKFFSKLLRNMIFLTILILTLSLKNNLEAKDFKSKFIMPVDGIITGVYGSQRILNGKPKWPHYGIDIAADQGTHIKSSGRGRIMVLR